MTCLCLFNLMLKQCSFASLTTILDESRESQPKNTQALCTCFFSIYIYVYIYIFDSCQILVSTSACSLSPSLQVGPLCLAARSRPRRWDSNTSGDQTQDMGSDHTRYISTSCGAYSFFVACLAPSCHEYMPANFPGLRSGLDRLVPFVGAFR